MPESKDPENVQIVQATSRRFLQNWRHSRYARGARLVWFADGVGADDVCAVLFDRLLHGFHEKAENFTAVSGIGVVVELLVFEINVTKIHGGGLEGKEQDAGAAIIQALMRHGGGNFLNGHLDGVGIFQQWQVKRKVGTLEANAAQVALALMKEAVFAFVDGGRAATDTVGLHVLALRWLVCRFYFAVMFHW